MRKAITLIFLLSTLNLTARNWSALIKAIIQVESEGNPKAVKGDQVGCMQIRPILVKDCNRILKMRKSPKRFTMKDRYSVSKSKEMFILYQSYYNPKGNMEKAIRLWNGGSNYTIRGTQAYYRKVKKQLSK